MENFLWCQPNDILFPIPTHRIWDTCHLIFYKIPIPTIILSYEPKEAFVILKENLACKTSLVGESVRASWTYTLHPLC